MATLARDEPILRYRWVPPLITGLILGGIAGMVVSVVAWRATRPTPRLLARQFDVQQVATSAGLTVLADLSDPLGRSAGTTDQAEAVRRQVVLVGTVPVGGADGVRPTLDLAVVTGVARLGGGRTKGGIHTTLAADKEYGHTLGTTYHTRDGRTGQTDVVFLAVDGTIRVVLTLSEAE